MRQDVWMTRAERQIASVLIAAVVLGALFFGGRMLLGRKTPVHLGGGPMITCEYFSTPAPTCHPLEAWWCHESIDIPDPHLKPDGTDHLCNVDELRRFQATR